MLLANRAIFSYLLISFYGYLSDGSEILNLFIFIFPLWARSLFILACFVDISPLPFYK
ncbi:hypothetical protein DB41_GU00120 [Neochlamydia sp. TUME1]|nr:hypothetical protein DB41_GU00120 [Neochlamydia sp. TUME1]